MVLGINQAHVKAEHMKRMKQLAEMSCLVVILPEVRKKLIKLMIVK